MTYDPYQDQGSNPYGPQWSGPQSVASPAPYFPPAEQYPGVQQTDVGFSAPPLPPKRQNVPVIILSTVLATVVVGGLVLCGLGFFGVVLIGASADTSSASPTPKASATSSPSPTATPRPSSSAQLVQSAGGPYSYRLPAGFEIITTSTPSATAGPSASPDPDPAPETSHPTAVSTPTSSQYDFIAVSSFTLEEAATELNLTARAARFDRWIKASGADPATRAHVMVGSYAAFKYTYAEGARAGYGYYVFQGRTVIEVSCLWSSDQAEMQRGCKEVLNTLTITGA